jgi:hypothetical protein
MDNKTKHNFRRFQENSKTVPLGTKEPKLSSQSMDFVCENKKKKNRNCLILWETELLLTSYSFQMEGIVGTKS